EAGLHHAQRGAIEGRSRSALAHRPCRALRHARDGDVALALDRFPARAALPEDHRGRIAGRVPGILVPARLTGAAAGAFPLDQRGRLRVPGAEAWLRGGAATGGARGGDVAIERDRRGIDRFPAVRFRIETPEHHVDTPREVREVTGRAGAFAAHLVEEDLVAVMD